jgi:hypothetical protein
MDTVFFRNPGSVGKERVLLGPREFLLKFTIKEEGSEQNLPRPLQNIFPGGRIPSHWDGPRQGEIRYDGFPPKNKRASRVDPDRKSAL